jgi:hypothetical protein
MAKSIDLGCGLSFASITAGKAHFEPMLKNTPIDTHVTFEELTELRSLYEQYCRKTNWPLSSPPAAFYPTYERGAAYTTRCFGINFEDGSTGRFSLDKALSAVATQTYVRYPPLSAVMRVVS